MAYNGGEGAVISYERRGVLPRETEGYLRKIKGTWDMYEKVYSNVWYGTGTSGSTDKAKDDEMQKQLKQKIDALKGKEEGLTEYKGQNWEFKVFWPPTSK